MGLAGQSKHAVDDGQHLRPLAKGTECAYFDEALQGTPIYLAQVDTAAKVVHAGKGTIHTASLQDDFDGTFTYVLHCAQPKTDGLTVVNIFDGEVNVALVNIRW